MSKFNYTYIQEITNENVQLQIEIVSVIITTLPAVIFDLNQQKTKLDFAEISRLAHKLKTSARMLQMNFLLEDILFLEETDLTLIEQQQIIQKIEHITTNFNEVLNQLSIDLDELEQDS